MGEGPNGCEWAVGRKCSARRKDGPLRLPVIRAPDFAAVPWGLPPRRLDCPENTIMRLDVAGARMAQIRRVNIDRNAFDQGRAEIFAPTDPARHRPFAVSPLRRVAHSPFRNQGDGFAQVARSLAIRRARNSSSFCCWSGSSSGANPARVWSKAWLFSCTVFIRTARSLSMAS